MIINNSTNTNPNFTALNFSKSKQTKSITNLATNYIDEFIKVMADSSQKKEVNHVIIDILPRLKDVEFPSIKNGENINSWLIKSLLPTKHYCLFLHGGTSTVTNYQPLYRELSNSNINILALEYPGYGNNKKLETSYETIYDSALSAHKYLTETLNIPTEEISILGYCLGGQLASKLAAKTKCKSLLLVSPVTKFGEVGEGYIKSKNLPERFPNRLHKLITSSKLFKLFVQNKLNCFEKLNKIDAPVYIFSSHEDVVTHKKWMDRLIHRLDNDNNITYINGFEEGHALTDSKIQLINELLGGKIYKSKLDLRF